MGISGRELKDASGPVFRWARAGASRAIVCGGFLLISAPACAEEGDAIRIVSPSVVELEGRYFDLQGDTARPRTSERGATVTWINWLTYEIAHDVEAFGVGVAIEVREGTFAEKWEVNRKVALDQEPKWAGPRDARDGYEIIYSKWTKTGSNFFVPETGGEDFHVVCASLMAPTYCALNVSDATTENLMYTVRLYTVDPMEIDYYELARRVRHVFYCLEVTEIYDEDYKPRPYLEKGDRWTCERDGISVSR